MYKHEIFKFLCKIYENDRSHGQVSWEIRVVLQSSEFDNWKEERRPNYEIFCQLITLQVVISLSELSYSKFNISEKKHYKV